MKYLWFAVAAFIPTILLAESGRDESTNKSTKPRSVTVDGKLVSVAEVLESRYGTRLQEDAAGALMAIEREDGSLIVLLKTTGAAMLFNEKRLREKPLRVKGLIYPGLEMLDVISFHLVKDGELHEAYYWCDTCVIKVHRPGRCPCCPSQVEYREEPVAP